MRVLDFTCGDMPVQRGEEVAPGLAVYRTPSSEFELSRLDLAGDTEVRVDDAGPQILICVQGGVRVHGGGGLELVLVKGQSMWLAAADPAVVVRSVDGEPALVFRATAGA
jgi:mannose-6-phosphate isomerase